MVVVITGLAVLRRHMAAMHMKVGKKEETNGTSNTTIRDMNGTSISTSMGKRRIK